MHINKSHMLFIKIKFGMDINHHDELLETIWEHMEEMKRGKKGRGGGVIIKLIHFHLIIRAHSIHSQIFPNHMVLVLMYL
jgi:hypothetical protein